MKFTFAIVLFFLASCVNGTLYLSNNDAKVQRLEDDNNYVNKDLNGEISESVLFDFDHVIADKPLFIGDEILVNTNSGRSYVFGYDEGELYENSSMRLSLGNDVAPILYKNFLVYALGRGRDNLLLYDLSNESFVWEKRVPFGIESKPLVENDYIYVASMNGLMLKLFLGDGKEIWRKNLNEFVHADIAESGDLIYVINNAGKVIAMNKSDGKTKWEKSIAESASYSKPLVLNHQLILATIHGHIVSLAKSDGSELWSLNVNQPIFGNLASDGKHIYLGSNAERLYKISMTGDIVWQFETQGIVNVQPLIGEKNIYFGSGNGYFYIIDKEDASVIWTRRFEGRFRSSPVFWGDRLVVFSDNDDVYQLESKSN